LVVKASTPESLRYVRKDCCLSASVAMACAPA